MKTSKSQRLNTTHFEKYQWKKIAYFAKLPEDIKMSLTVPIKDKRGGSPNISDNPKCWISKW